MDPFRILRVVGESVTVSLPSTLIGALPGVMVSWFCMPMPVEETVTRAVEASGSRAPERRNMQRTGAVLPWVEPRERSEYGSEDRSRRRDTR
jgi:hypothetical protein